MTSMMADHKYARELARLRDQVKQLEEQVRVGIITQSLSHFKHEHSFGPKSER